MRILITGSRQVDIAAERLVSQVLAEACSLARHAGYLDSEITIVHGAAPGVDTVAAMWAEMASLSAERHPAEWVKLGKRAGVMRNLHMVSLGADVCLAFPRKSSTGTWHCIRAAADAGIPVRIYPLPETS